MALRIVEKEISLTEYIPIIVVTYIDVISCIKGYHFTNACGHHASRNNCMGKGNRIIVWITMLLPFKKMVKTVGYLPLRKNGKSA